jgi:hypothetical protein
MEIIGEKQYNGVDFKQCRCTCGGIFFAPTEDIASGEVHSCGHPHAGMDLQRIIDKRRKRKNDETLDDHVPADGDSGLSVVDMSIQPVT